jgi:hypothetical protein
MAKRKVSARRKSASRKAPRRAPTRAKIGRIYTGDEALHELFREQAAAMLGDAQVSEDEKQSILAALTCPCCGAGSMSVSVKLKSKARFAAEEP